MSICRWFALTDKTSGDKTSGDKTSFVILTKSL